MAGCTVHISSLASFHCVRSLNCEPIHFLYSITSGRWAVNRILPGFHCLKSLNCEPVPSTASVHWTVNEYTSSLLMPQFTQLWMSSFPGFHYISSQNHKQVLPRLPLPQITELWTSTLLGSIASAHRTVNQYTSKLPVPQFTELWTSTPPASTASDHWTVNQYTSWLP